MRGGGLSFPGKPCRRFVKDFGREEAEGAGWEEMRRRIHILVVGAFLFHAIDFAQSASSSAPERREKPVLLNDFLAAGCKEFDLPAAGAVVIRGGRVAAWGVAGKRRAGGPEKATLRDKWHLGSITKPMTATLAAILVEEGGIRWDSTIGEMFPEWTDAMRPEYRRATLRQLLCHRGGFPERAPPAAWAEAWRRRGATQEQRRRFVRAVLEQKPEAPPGERFIYSNQGYTVAGAMLEKAAGEPWEILIRRKLFNPLGMRSAGFGPPAAPGRVDQPWGHVRENQAWKPIPPGPQADNPPAIGPAGRVHCSLADLAKFLLLHLGRIPPGLRLSQAALARLHTPPEKGSYALGWVVANREWARGAALTHAGSNTMFYAVVWLALKRDFALAVVTNCAGPGVAEAEDSIAWRLIQKFLLRPQPPAPAPSGAAESPS